MCLHLYLKAEHEALIDMAGNRDQFAKFSNTWDGKHLKTMLAQFGATFV